VHSINSLHDRKKDSIEGSFSLHPSPLACLTIPAKIKVDALRVSFLKIYAVHTQCILVMKKFLTAFLILFETRVNSFVQVWRVRYYYLSLLGIKMHQRFLLSVLRRQVRAAISIK
jgi:hypothetical protein